MRDRGKPGVSRLAVCFLVSLAGACDSTGPPASPSPISPSPTSSSAQAGAPIRLSGRVTNEAGSPVAGALIKVEYGQGSSRSTRTNSDGVYEFEPAPYGGGFVSFVASDSYETKIQMFPASFTDIIQNLRLRRVRTINAGESIAVSVEPDSPRCVDLEDLFALGMLCERVRIVAGMAGTLLVEARAVNTGGTVPSLFWTGTGAYLVPVRRPGATSIPVQGGEYHILIGAPADMPAERFEVLTSLR